LEDATSGNKQQLAATSGNSQVLEVKAFKQQAATGSNSRQHTATRLAPRSPETVPKPSGFLRFDELKPELRGPLLEELYLLLAVSLLVIRQALVDVLVAPVQHAVDEASELVSHRGDGFRRAEFAAEAPVLSAEVALASEQRGGGQAEGGRGSIDDVPGATFAVHRLIAWYREGADVQARLPLLATYLGHASVAATSVYLTMTAELLVEASVRFERYALPVQEATHG
jgi:hypothetical protein